jgi:hypothetical protein
VLACTTPIPYSGGVCGSIFEPTKNPSTILFPRRAPPLRMSISHALDQQDALDQQTGKEYPGGCA